MLPILHALYEECKLNLAPHTEGLAALAHNTAMFSGNVRYQRYFSSEYPHLQSAEVSDDIVYFLLQTLLVGRGCSRVCTVYQTLLVGRGTAEFVVLQTLLVEEGV